MHTNSLSFVATLSALLFLLVGCTKPPELEQSSAAPAAPAKNISAISTDEWLGKWNGPEGTFLQLSGSDGKYEVTIQNLDGPRTFHGNAVGDQVEFERDGLKESLRATNGVKTGMKWLSEKSNCLTVRAGEGYCRD